MAMLRNNFHRLQIDDASTRRKKEPAKFSHYTPEQVYKACYRRRSYARALIDRLSCSMSSANVLIAAPKHAGDDHPLVYPDAQSQEAPAETDSSKSGSNAASASAAFSRALAGMLAFMFKRPIRLFRPVKSESGPPLHIAVRHRLSALCFFDSLDYGGDSGYRRGTRTVGYAGVCSWLDPQGRREFSGPSYDTRAGSLLPLCSGDSSRSTSCRRLRSTP